MNSRDAAATGALPGDVQDSDLQPDHPRPPSATNPDWYAAAAFIVPRDIGSTARRGWIEGYVAAMEIMREVSLI